MTNVYVVESGEYEQRGVTGIYSTLENAMATQPGNWEQLDDWDMKTDTWVPGTTRWGLNRTMPTRIPDTTIELYELDK